MTLKERLKGGKLVTDGKLIKGIIKDLGGNIVDVFSVNHAVPNRKVISLDSQSYRDSFTKEQRLLIKSLFDGVKDDK